MRNPAEIQSIINKIETWRRNDAQNRTVIAVFRDLQSKIVTTSFYGPVLEVGACVRDLMMRNEDIADSIFKYALAYAMIKFPPEYIEEAIQVARKVADGMTNKNESNERD
jgi:hypothetical protein